MLKICAVYFTTIYWMARHISADSAPAAGSTDAAAQAQGGIQVLPTPNPSTGTQRVALTATIKRVAQRLHPVCLTHHPGQRLADSGFTTECGRVLHAQVLEAATAIAVSAVICYVGSSYAAAIGSPGLTIPVVTAITGGSACSSIAVSLCLMQHIHDHPMYTCSWHLHVGPHSVCSRAAKQSATNSCSVQWRSLRSSPGLCSR